MKRVLVLLYSVLFAVQARSQWVNCTNTSSATCTGSSVAVGTTSPIAKFTAYDASAQPLTGLFLSNDTHALIWYNTLTVRQNLADTVIAGSGPSIGGEPLASTGSIYYGASSIKFVRENSTANNQDTAIGFWTRAGSNNNNTD